MAGTGGIVNVTPGLYCGGLTVTGTGTVEFAAGDYFIQDGELFIAGTIAADGTAGVTFFMTGADANINFAGTADITLNAPTGGTRPGYIFIGDKGANAATNKHILRGTSMGGYNGYIYLPEGLVRMVGTADPLVFASTCTVVVADMFEFYGTPVFEAEGGCSQFGSVTASGPATSCARSYNAPG